MTVFQEQEHRTLAGAKAAAPTRETRGSLKGIDCDVCLPAASCTHQGAVRENHLQVVMIYAFHSVCLRCAQALSRSTSVS